MYLEPWFILWYYGGMTYKEYRSFPIAYRTWLINRMMREIKHSSENKADIPDKSPHNNTDQVRAMAGRVKQQGTKSPKLQRFT